MCDKLCTKTQSWKVSLPQEWAAKIGDVRIEFAGQKNEVL